MKITLEESTTDCIPTILEDIIKRIASQNRPSDSFQKDYLFILLIVSLIENGFLPLNNESEIIDQSSINLKHISKWKSQSGIFEAIFIMAGFKNISLKLIMSPLGAMALVNVVIKDLDSETYSVCLPISRYIVSPQATKIPMIFRDLKHFSVTFKNKILSALKSRILSYYGYASASLMGLPEELLFQIMLNLSAFDVLNVSKTCMRFKVLLHSNILWHDMIKRDFSNISLSEEEDWKKLYKEAYISQQDKVQRRLKNAAGAMHDYMDYSDYVSYIDNPMWNVLL